MQICVRWVQTHLSEKDAWQNSTIQYVNARQSLISLPISKRNWRCQFCVSPAMPASKMLQAGSSFPGAGHDGHLQRERRVWRKALSVLLLLWRHDLHGSEELWTSTVFLWAGTEPGLFSFFKDCSSLYIMRMTEKDSQISYCFALTLKSKH